MNELDFYYTFKCMFSNQKEKKNRTKTILSLLSCHFVKHLTTYNETIMYKILNTYFNNEYFFDYLFVITSLLFISFPDFEYI